MEMQVKGVLSGQILAEAPFQITNLAVATKPPTAPYGHVVKYTFAGFRPNKPSATPRAAARSSSPTSSARRRAPAASSTRR